MSRVRVRMYRQGGIGDCFLLSFGDGKGPHILIDCGILKGTHNGADAMKKAIQNVAEVTGKKLDVLVVTHEHWDHVSGFLQAQEEFKQIKIGEVWLAWTEEPGNELAGRLRKQREKAKQAVAAASLRLRGLMGSSGRQSEPLEVLERLGLFYMDETLESQGRDEPPGAAPADASPGAADQPAPAAEGPSVYSTAGAMEWARLKTGGRVSYLSPGKDPLSLQNAEGVRVFVLGPPQNEAQIKKDNPSKRAPEVYSLSAGNDLGFFAAVEGQNGESDGKPFHDSFELKIKDAADQVFFQKTYFADEERWRKIDLDWLWTAQRLALQLDSDTNNTSLALAFELVDSGKVLLFPGDAQVGNWLSWQGLEWTVRNSQGDPEKVTAENLLERTVLYKVGHHASHNATLRWGLELMAGEDLCALIPVYETQARDQGKKGWDMPFGPLLERLQEKTGGRVLRSDQGAPDVLDPRFTGKCNVQEGWIDVWVGE